MRRKKERGLGAGAGKLCKGSKASQKESNNVKR